jgi:outer membrane lipoprotein SlyB
MGQNENDKLRENAARDNGVEDNLFNYASTARVSEHLESTQLNKFGTKGGTGFAAEDANALNEKLTGKKVDQVGANNAKNGADRIVDGVPIQTKYFDSAARTVNDAFDKATGTYRYPGMQLEVPRDQYEKAVALMREKIAAGQVPGVTNPDDATKIIKEGSITFQQAKNIARAGNIESLKYDAKNNLVTSGYAFAISFAICFARAKWEGRSTKDALKESVGMGLLSAGTSFVGGMVTSQLLRTKAARQATVFVKKGIKIIADTDWGRIAVDKIASAAADKPLSGAAATNYLSKLVRSNVITGAVTTVVITGPDIYRAAFSKNTSWAQVGKNLLVNGVGVAGGTAGWTGGAAVGAMAGTAILPGPGTAIGGAIGALAGSMGAGAGASWLAKKALDFVIEDDSKEMTAIIEAFLPELGDEYLMTQPEFDLLIAEVGKECTVDFFRMMYAMDDRKLFLRVCFEPACEAIINRRKPVILPVEEKVQEVLDEIIAGIDADATDEQEEVADTPYVPNFVFANQKDVDVELLATTVTSTMTVGPVASLLGALGRFKF